MPTGTPNGEYVRASADWLAAEPCRYVTIVTSQGGVLSRGRFNGLAGPVVVV
jgi:hypothetical protein